MKENSTKLYCQTNLEYWKHGRGLKCNRYTVSILSSIWINSDDSLTQHDVAEVTTAGSLICCFLGTKACHRSIPQIPSQKTTMFGGSQSAPWPYLPGHPCQSNMCGMHGHGRHGEEQDPSTLDETNIQAFLEWPIQNCVNINPEIRCKRTHFLLVSFLSRSQPGWWHKDQT